MGRRGALLRCGLGAEEDKASGQGMPFRVGSLKFPPFLQTVPPTWDHRPQHLNVWGSFTFKS